MITKFKRPDQYIGHGVWLFRSQEDFYPVKMKISSVDIGYKTDNEGKIDWDVLKVYIKGYPFSPKEVFITRKAAILSKGFKCMDSIRSLKNSIRIKESEIKEKEFKIKSMKEQINKLEEYLKKT